MTRNGRPATTRQFWRLFSDRWRLFHPHDSTESMVQLLEKSFLEAVDEFMTERARTGFQPSKEALAPLKPIAFEIAGRNFTWEPPEVPRSQERS